MKELQMSRQSVNLITNWQHTAADIQISCAVHFILTVTWVGRVTIHDKPLTTQPSSNKQIHKFTHNHSVKCWQQRVIKGDDRQWVIKGDNSLQVTKGNDRPCWWISCLVEEFRRVILTLFSPKPSWLALYSSWTVLCNWTLHLQRQPPSVTWFTAHTQSSVSLFHRTHPALYQSLSYILTYVSH